MDPRRPSADLDSPRALKLFSRETFASLNSPQAWKLFYQTVGILAGLVAVWLVLAAILSLISAWFLVLITLALGGVLLYRLWSQKRRAAWIESGCCGQCGYDLRATPEICPECGRDASLDEPTWKKVRRSFATKRAAEARNTGAFSPPPDIAPATLRPPAPLQLKKVVLRRPVVDSEPIPLEPLPEPQPLIDPADR